MAITAHSLEQADYQTLLWRLLNQIEGNKPRAYVDTVGWATIGIGYNMAAHPDAILDLYTLTTADRALLRDVMTTHYANNDSARLLAAARPILARNGYSDFALTAAQISSVFPAFVDDEEDKLDAWLARSQGFNLVSIVGTRDAPSFERLALMDMTYNGLIGGTQSPGLRRALELGNRALAWYECRENQGQVELYKRRYIDGALFGLYEPGTTAENISSEESINIFSTFSQPKIRETIFRHENSASTLIPGAQSDITAALGDRAPSVRRLEDELAWAANKLISDNRAQSLGFFDANAISALDIQVALASGSSLSGSIRNGYLVDSTNDDHNDLLIGQDGADSLKGLDGNDALIGNGGADTLEGGAGNDYLNGGTGSDRLRGGAGDDKYYVASGPSAETDTIEDTEGNDQLFLDGNQIGALTRVSQDVWETAGGAIRVTRMVSAAQTDIVVEIARTNNRVVIKNWTQGRFGLNLGGEIQASSTTYSTSYTAENDSADAQFAGASASSAMRTTHYAFEDAAFVLRPDAAAGYTDSYAMYGFGGNDGLSGGAGDDRLDGGDGDDFIAGGGGSDYISGGAGNDYIFNYDGHFTWASSVQVYQDGAFTWIPVDQYIAGLAGQDDRIYSYGNAWYLAAAGAHSGDVTQFFQNMYFVGLVWSNGTAGPETEDRQDVIDAGDGSDVVFGGKGADIINGGAGNDVLTGGKDADDIDGNEGDDVIFGDRIYGNLDLSWHNPADTVTGDDLLFGGDGNDWLYGQGGSDTLLGGDGDDILRGDRYGEIAGAAIEIAEAPGNDYLDGGAGDDRLFGNAGNDVLLGGSGADFLYGDDEVTPGDEHGDDVIEGGQGDDTVWGGGGNDVISGDDGDDLLIGDSNTSELAIQFHGNDSLFGGAGKDELQGGGGNDILDGGSDDDRLFGETGDDVVSGGDGNDQLSGGDGADVLDGGAGNDLVIGGGGDDYLVGGIGDDELQGNDGDDRQEGGEGNDKLFGGNGKNVLDGGDGDDRLYADAGDDTLSGGAGADFLGGGDGNDSLSGGAGNDTLDGETGNDTIYGDDRDDTIDGDDGDDLIYAGTGNDSVYGGSGRDVIHGEDGDDTVSGAEGDDEVRGGTGNDSLHGNDGNDSLYGEDGDDYLTGGAGNDTLVGGGGLNRYYFDRNFGQDVIQLAPGSQDQIYLRDGIAAEEVTFARDQQDLLLSLADGSSLRVSGYFSQDAAAWIQFADGTWLGRVAVETGAYYGTVVVGTGGNDTLTGNEGDNRLYGQAGNDILNGMGGNDQLFGGAGDDQLDGGSGNDQLNGGAGNDKYLFGFGSGKDIVDGLAAAGSGVDTLVLGAGVTTSNIQVSVGLNGSLVLSLSSGADTVTLNGYFATQTEPLSIRFPSGTVWTRDQMLTRLGGSSGGIYSGADFIGGVGTEISNDTLLGSNYADNLYGKAGADVLYGRDGNDNLFGDDELNNWAQFDNGDQLYGGNGNDTLYGYFGADWLDGGAGVDFLYGGDGDDTLIGGAGNDQLKGGPGSNTYRFKSGFASDMLAFGVGGAEMATLVFEDALASQATITRTETSLVVKVGTDMVTVSGLGLSQQNLSLAFKDGAVLGWRDIVALTTTGTAGNDQLWGSDLDDVLDGKDGSDYLSGGAGNDRLLGGAGNDTLDGGAGDDVLDGGAGSDQLRGGDGRDTYVLAIGQGQDSVLDSTSIVRIGAGITPQDLKATIQDYGYYQHLTLAVAGTSDALVFDITLSSSDQQDVALPFDKVEFADGTVWDATQVRAMLSPAYLLGTGQDDMILGDTAANKVYGFGGNDIINSLDGNDTVLGGIGDDVVSGGQGDDTLYGESGSDSVAGGDGDDYAYGDAGNDVVTGGAGRDYVFGDSFFGSGSTQADGDDVLQGGAGNDELDGGLGNDVFLFNLGDGDDVIVDSATAYNPYNNYRDPGFDVIRFGPGIKLEDLDFSIAYRSASGGNDGDLVISNRLSGDRITVKYVVLSAGYSGGGGPLSTIDRIEFADGSSIDYASMMSRAGYLGNMIIGTSGNDTLQGTKGVDVLDGQGDNGQDTLSGGGGSDIYLFGRNSGRDYIYDSYYTYDPATNNWGYTPQDGVDVVKFEVGVSASDLYVDPYYRGIGIKGSDVFLCQWQGIEEFHFADGTVWDQAAIAQFLVTPTEDDNLIQGTSANEVFEGLGGNDTLYGGDGDDILAGGVGNDFLYGGAGDDVIRYQLGEGSDSVSGGEGLDVLELGAGITPASLAVGRRSGSLYLALNGTDDGVRIDGVFAYDYSDPARYGGDIERVRFADGSEVALSELVPDISTGNDASQDLIGTDGADTIYAKRGDDWLLGLAGNDDLIGGAGMDRLEGGVGDDFLSGGDGDDSYYFEVGGGHDVVDNRDADGGEDVASFGYSVNEMAVTRNASDLIVTFAGGSDSITFQHWFDDASARIDRVWAKDTSLDADGLQAMLPAGAAAKVSAGTDALVNLDAMMAPSWIEARDSASFVVAVSSDVLVPEASAVMAALSMHIADEGRPDVSAVQLLAQPTYMKPSPHNELQQLVDSLASFSSQGGLLAENDGHTENALSELSRLSNWKVNNRSDGLHVRQVEL